MEFRGSGLTPSKQLLPRCLLEPQKGPIGWGLPGMIFEYPGVSNDKIILVLGVMGTSARSDNHDNCRFSDVPRWGGGRYSVVSRDQPTKIQKSNIPQHPDEK